MLWGKISITSEAAVGMRAGAESLGSWRGEQGCWGAAELLIRKGHGNTPRAALCEAESESTT